MTVRTGFFARNWKRARTLQARYRKDSQGATAIEFGIVSVPFLAIIFGILELALVFFTGSVLTQSISDTGRMVRVGSFQSCGQAAEFKSLVCARMKNMMNCNANLRVDLVTASNFQAVTLVDPGDSGLDPDDEDKEIEEGVYTNTGPGEPVVLRATFYYPLILPNAMTRLENLSGSGRRVITASTAFRNEPFPTGEPCNSSISNELQDIADA